MRNGTFFSFLMGIAATAGIIAVAKKTNIVQKVKDEYQSVKDQMCEDFDMEDTEEDCNKKTDVSSEKEIHHGDLHEPENMMKLNKEMHDTFDRFIRENNLNAQGTFHYGMNFSNENTTQEDPRDTEDTED